MKAAAQPPDLAPRKRPSQRRSRETCEALVQACAQVLTERGYAGTTTNHVAVRAGVGIASLYEYFPGKDALVAQVAERLVERVLARLAAAAGRAGDAAEADAVRSWIEAIHEIVGREKALVGVFLYQVPYTNEIEAIRSLGARLLEFSQEVRRHAGDFVRPDFSDATLHLVVNVVTSTILQLVLDPPRDVTRRALLDELVLRVEEWIRGAPPEAGARRARRGRAG